MKVALIAPYIEGPGGGGRYARDLAEALRSRGIGCQLSAVRGRSVNSFFAIWRGIRGADIVHVIDPMPLGVYALVAALLRRTPLVVSAQGTYAVAPLYNLKTAWLVRHVYRYAAAVVAISRFTRDEITRCVAVPIEVINHGVWLRNFAVSARTKPADLLLLGVGGIKRRKGYHVALEAVALARKTHPDISYVIVGPVGSPGYAKELHERAQQPDLRGAVEFKEKVSDIELKALYGSASIFLLPSVNEGHHFEGFGLVFLEAAATGLPVIGTRGNGIEDAVQDGVTGILVPQHDAPAIAAALEKILAQWEPMSAAARMFAAGRDWHTVAGEYETLYARVLALKGKSV